MSTIYVLHIPYIYIFRYIFIIYSLYIHYIFTICSLHIHYIFITFHDIHIIIIIISTSNNFKSGRQGALCRRSSWWQLVRDILGGKEHLWGIRPRAGLVGGIPTPLKNMSSSVGMMTFPIYGKIKNVPNHQPVENSLFLFRSMILPWKTRWCCLIFQLAPPFIQMIFPLKPPFGSKIFQLAIIDYHRVVAFRIIL